MNQILAQQLAYIEQILETMTKNNQQLSVENFLKQLKEVEGIIMVQFLANWSGTSSLMASVYKAIRKEFKSQLQFIQFDVDAHPEIADAFHINKIPTALFFRAGEIIHCTPGIISKYELTEKIEQLLKPDTS